MSEMPRGTVAFLFTDVENSSALWERDGAAMMSAMARHVALLREAVSAHGGVLFKTVGDGTQSAFPTAPAALCAALAAQRALLAEPWPDELGPLRACMAIHAGEAEPRGGDYLAAPLNRLARLLGMARGGQILLTEAVEQLAQDGLPPGASLQELGEMRLRDLKRAERVFVLVHPDLPQDIDLPVASDQRTRHFPASLTPFLGREEQIRLSRNSLRLRTSIWSPSPDRVGLVRRGWPSRSVSGWRPRSPAAPYSSICRHCEIRLRSCPPLARHSACAR